MNTKNDSACKKQTEFDFLWSNIEDIRMEIRVLYGIMVLILVVVFAAVFALCLYHVAA